MRWLAHLLVLLLAMPQARAEGGALCDRAAADPDAAIPSCTQLIEHPPEGINVAGAYNNRGVAKFGKGYLDDAIADFTSALNQNPKFVDAFKNRGLAYKMQGAADKAIDDFNKAIRLNGNSPELYNLRGAALLDKLEFNRAIADFEKAISLNQKYRNAFVNRGLAFVFTRQLSRAIADFDMVVRLSPNTSGPYTRRGEAWRLQGNLQRSLDDHNKAIALNPVDLEAYNNRALTFKDLGKLAEAIADCDQAIVLNKNSDFAYATRGLILQLQGNLWRSLTDLNKAVELKPNSPIALTFRGDTLRDSGNISGAMEDFNKAILILPDFVAAYTGRGLTYEKKGEVANAKADYEKALSLSAEVDAGLARPSKAKARERLAALAAAEAARVKEAAERAEQEVRAKAAAELAATSTPVKLPPQIPGDIQKVLQRRGHALLIGESHYTRGWDELASVRHDLQTLKAGLTPYFETVETVQDPTVSQLRERMREFLLGKWNTPDERLFIYYAGHGFTDFNQASRENNGYITGSDTPRYDLSPGKAIENAVPFTEIDSWNRQTRARHVLMVFDSCFSGTLFQTMGSEEELRRKDLDGIRRMLGQPIRYYITSGRKEEAVTADSTFATLLLRGLRGEADFFRQGLVSADQLGIYLSREVPKYSHRPQTPQFSSIGDAKLSEGQFFFLTGTR